jgi:hypothetical protein
MHGYDFSSVSGKFYDFYCLFIACQLFLISLYSLFLLCFTDSRHYKTKIIFLWLFFAETSTFIDHVIRKYFLILGHSLTQMIITNIIFCFCCSFLFVRSLLGNKTVNFDSKKTYIVKFKPANIAGVFNHIINLKGHSGVYQDGELYKFKKSSGRVEARKVSKKYMISSSIRLEEIKRKNFINLIGKEFNLFKYNCNHLTNEAKK